VAQIRRYFRLEARNAFQATHIGTKMLTLLKHVEEKLQDVTNCDFNSLVPKKARR